MIKKTFSSLWPQIILLTTVIILGIVNYTPGSWISGWDNLHPEFDFALNIKRSLFAVWQQYQGLGLLGGLGHASELPRQFILFLLSFFFPLQYLRLIYFLLCLFFGALGIYYLLSKIFHKEDKTISLLGALFYIFNLATVQTFYLQYETFTTHYAILPWLFFSTYSYLKNPTKKTLLFFFIITVLGIPQGFVPTLFFVSYLSVFFCMFFWSFLKNKFSSFKNIILLALLTLLVNSFWLLPFSYFTVTNRNIVKVAKINEMSSEDHYLNNLKTSSLKNAAILKGFWFDSNDFDKKQNLIPLMGEWKTHLQNPINSMLGYFIFCVILLGIFAAVRRKKKVLIPFIFLLLIFFSILSNQTIPFSFIFKIIERIPLFSEVFRIYFTKISVITAFIFTIFFSEGIAYILSLYYMKRVAYVFLGGLIASLLIFIFPLFTGNLFYKQLKVEIPQEYFQLMDFFSKQKQNARIANLPQYTYMYWNFYNWGYRGSGFLWYGIKQSILDRAFDVWSYFNENYYWELSYALYSQNIDLFESILEKYQINWLVYDKNIINPSLPRSLYTEKIQELINKSNKIQFSTNFGNVDVYEVRLKQNLNDFVFFLDNPPNIKPIYQWNNVDQAYKNYSSYISLDKDNDTEYYYPFREIFSNKTDKNNNTSIDILDDSFILTSTLPQNLKGSIFSLPNLNQEEFYEFQTNDLSKKKVRYPDIFLDSKILLSSQEISGGLRSVQIDDFKDGKFSIRLPKVKGYYSYDSYVDSSLSNQPPQSCDQINKGTIQKEIIGGKQPKIRLFSINSSNCLILNLSSLEQKRGYLVSINAKHHTGKPILFTVTNNTSQHYDLQSYLPKNTAEFNLPFILPPMEKYGVGYTFSLDNISIGQIPTINDVGRITVNSFPYDFISSLQFVKKNNTSFSLLKQNFESVISRPNDSLYIVNLKLNNLSTASLFLGLSQGFNNGWLAYKIECQNSKLKCQIYSFLPFLFGKELKEHVLVNNWANGWKLDGKTWNEKRGTSNIIIIFWPQYLEFLGFGLLISSFLFIIIAKFRPEDKNGV